MLVATCLKYVHFSSPAARVLYTSLRAWLEGLQLWRQPWWAVPNSPCGATNSPQHRGTREARTGSTERAEWVSYLHSEPKTQVLGVTLLFSLLMNNPPIIIHHDEKYWEVVLWLLPTTAKVISFSSLTCVQINYQCKIQNAWRNATRFIFAPGENYLQLQ